MKSSYSNNPSYFDLFLGYFEVLNWWYGPKMMKEYSFPMSFFAEFRKLFYIELHETEAIFLWSIFFTICRFFFERIICKVSHDDLK